MIYILFISFSFLKERQVLMNKIRDTDSLLKKMKTRSVIPLFLVKKT